MKRLAWLAAALLVGVIAYLGLWPVPIEPVAWLPPASDTLRGSFARTQDFDGLDYRADALGPGPEDIAQGPDGWYYAGLQDGRIVRFRPGGGLPQEFANTGGRPLGMQFDGDGRLIVADAFKGLLAVAPDATLRVLTDSVDGVRLMYPDDLDIADDGTVWFTNASQRDHDHQWILDFWEGQATGQLLSWDPRTGATTIRLEGLRFANGVALGPDDTYVLVNETMARRIVRLWLKGPKAGSHELFADGLPGHPDNLSYDGSGLFWVALPSRRSALFDWLAPRPFLRKVLLRLPASWIDVRPPPLGWVVAIDEDGNARHDLRDESGRYTDITSVNEFDGRLYLGSIKMSSAASLDLPGPAP